ncbi:TIGR02677 family protein [Ralstonia pseudosolanacearum]|uniref:TIGR02677 family protein n=1 Tax=Ralstonia pseudosolanacearum TaxID=1310165 RepID=UPI002675A1B7|nr:TIGR02677 family protein [Ralstonia pseudosolanacearum]MDO3507316.1 TIGR02677 family protein [Ralstonia pseudosolanacearum]MDO3514748.1 TIGR02677 family protein [Ralstonia pseudosolanacearum]MDO3539282.1 TIGR02677 family protein [Ralstonia pseudosolanacearum]MDO3606790.1 TIGR02677 family protein [Ralstonia pseudosolanacearum]MDO3610755.1 TIGR02677 family protein [Ralstonia pseudosolanacearum]
MYDIKLQRDTPADLFRHISAEKAVLYRCVMDCFAAAKRQFRLHLRPDEILNEGNWDRIPEHAQPRIEEVQAALAQLTEWGNLESQPDTTRVASISDFYRARFLYRLSQGGEAVEAALTTFERTLRRRAELQTVALEDISNRLQTLLSLADSANPDAAKIHETLRDLVRVFESLADNAQAFMAGIGRSIELQQAEVTAVLAYKKRLIDYLERFIGDLVGRSGDIAQRLVALSPRVDSLLWLAAQREARDSAPDDDPEQLDAVARGWQAWRERWKGLRGWFVTTGHEPPQAELLRSKARAAIPQLLTAVSALNERRSGRSDRSADFRMLAGWFAACEDDSQAHRLARAAFALNPARHFSLNPALAPGVQDLPASTPWAEAPPLRIHPRLREYGEAAPRGALPRVQARDEQRRLLAAQLEQEHAEIEAARLRLATGRATLLSELGALGTHDFALFLKLLGEALTAQMSPDAPVETQSGDGLLHIRLQPLASGTQAMITTPTGVFRGRDHTVTITRMEDLP